MKKLSKLLALAAGFATLFFAACSDMNSGTVGEGLNDRTANEKEYEVTLYTEDGLALDLSKWGVTSESSDSSRTIVSEGLGANLEDTSKVKFYIWGENQLSTTDTTITTPVEKKFTLSTGSTSVGKVTLGLSASRWNLKLAAVNVTALASATGDDLVTKIKSAAYYIGFANVDLRSATSIKFYLSADGLTGSGTATLKLKYDGISDGTWTLDHVKLVKDSNKYSVKAQITPRLQNNSGTAQTLDVTKFFPETPAATGTGSKAEDATGDEKVWSLSPGTYNFEVVFTSNSGNGDDSKTYVWSDIIIILPNQDVKCDVLVPDVVLYKPEAPANFKVGYIKPDSTATNTYNAVLTWEDKSNNEKFFEVQVANLAGATSPLTTAITTAAEDTDDTAWEAALTGTNVGTLKTLGESFYGNTDLGWVAGSLVKNNKGAVVKLALGTRYLMRIAAVNDAGHSSWTYATYNLTTPGEGETAISLNNGFTNVTFSPNPYAIKQIDDSKTAVADIYQPVTDKYAICANLYRLTYHLNGGTYSFNATTSVPVPPDTTNVLVYYLSQRAELASVPTTSTVGKIDPANRSTHAEAGIEIFTPTGDSEAIAADKYPSLIKSGNRWTSWRRGGIEGAYYQNTIVDYTGMNESQATALAPTTTTVTTTVTAAAAPAPAVTNSLDVFIPQNYHGYQNLDLFASYTVASAIVDIYVDENYDFYDKAPSTGTAVFGTDFEVELGTNSNLTKKNNKYYTFTYNGTTAGTNLTLNYKQKTGRVPAFSYDSIAVRIKKMAGGDTVAVGTVDASTKSYAFDIAPFGDGVFYITVIGEYKGHQYSYGITLNIVDATGQP